MDAKEIQDVFMPINCNVLNKDVATTISECYSLFMQEMDFLNQSVEILTGDNIASKKSFLISNKQHLDQVLLQLNTCFDNLDTADSNIYVERLRQYIYHTVDQFIVLTDKFKKELANDLVSGNEDIKIDHDTIEDAMKNNVNTKQIINDLNNIDNTDVIADEYTKNIQEKISDNQPKSNVKSVIRRKRKRYLVASSDLSDYVVLNEAIQTTDQLNIVLENLRNKNPGISKVFELVEVPTKIKVVVDKEV